MRILVVHPDPTLRTRISRALSDEGHTVVMLPDGERAIDRFVQEPADAVVLDLVLPGRDGAATIESIRWAPGGAKCAVVLTGSTEKKGDRLEAAARKINAVAWFAGDVDPEAIAGALSPIGRVVTEPTRVAPRAEIDAALANAVKTLEAPALIETRVSPDPQAGARGLADADTAHKISRAPSDATTGKVVSGSISTSGSGSHAGIDPHAFDEDLHTEVDEEEEEWARTDQAAASEGREVEARAAQIQDMAGDVEGDLASLPFPHLLYRIASRRASGALVVSRPEDVRPTTTGETPKKVVFFRNGVPVYVKSNLVQECLGQVLARSRRISSAALAESVQRMRQGEGRQGAILIAMGVMGPHDLRDALEEQLRLKLFDLFAWPTGTFRFTERMAPPPEIVTLELGLTEIVFEGVVKRIPAQRLLDALAPRMDHHVIPDARKVRRFTKLEMVPEAKKVALALDGRKTLRDLLATAGRRPGAAAQLVYAMECMEAIRYSRDPIVVPWDPEGSDPEGSRKDGDSGLQRDLGAAREELEQLARLLRAERWSDALGVVAGDLTGAQRAAEALTSRFKPLTQPGAAPREVRQLAFEVSARLATAPQRLAGRAEAPASQPTSVSRRGAINKTPSGESKPGGADAAVSAPPTVRGPPSGEASSLPAAVPTVQPMFLEDEYTTIPRAPAMRFSGDELPKVVGHAAGQAAAAAPLPEVRPTPTPAPTPVPAPEPSSRSSHPPRLDAEQSRQLDLRVEKMFQAEGWFRRGEKSLGRGKHGDALAAFEHAVELCPDEGEFLAWLGYARYAAFGDEPREISRAVDELGRGCTLAPKLDVAHLLLARVLRATGDVSKARDAYERALAANPDCREAYDAIRELAGR